MDIFTALLAATLEIADIVLSLYIWVLITSALLSWLIAFDVVNTRSRFVQIVGDFTFRLTEPLLKRIRRWVPVIGGMDVSPLVLILVIIFLRSFLNHLAI